MAGERGAAEGVVAPEVHCRGCGYDLRGLRPGGVCPECGTAVALTLAALTDPGASALPRLEHPRRVGRGLVWITGSALVAGGCVVAAPLLSWGAAVAEWTGMVRARGGIESWARAAEDLRLVGAAVMAAGVLGVWWLRPAVDAQGSLRREARLMMVGMVGWALLAAAWWGSGAGGLVRAAVTGGLCAAAALAFAGLSGALAVVGLRSRAYRRSRSAWQGARAMVAAVAGAGVGIAARELGAHAGSDGVRTLGTTVAGASLMMVYVGLIYLTASAWRIRSSLRRPPPRLSELVRAA